MAKFGSPDSCGDDPYFIPEGCDEAHFEAQGLGSGYFGHEGGHDAYYGEMGCDETDFGQVGCEEADFQFTADGGSYCDLQSPEGTVEEGVTPSTCSVCLSVSLLLSVIVACLMNPCFFQFLLLFSDCLLLCALDIFVISLLVLWLPKDFLLICSTLHYAEVTSWCLTIWNFILFISLIFSISIHIRKY